MAVTHPDFSGKWILIENVNFEEFLAANGAPWIARKAAGKVKSVIEIHQKGEPTTLTVKSKFMMGTREDTFTVGVPTEQTQQNGAVTEVIASWDGDKFVVHYTP